LCRIRFKQAATPASLNKTPHQAAELMALNVLATALKGQSYLGASATGSTKFSAVTAISKAPS